MCTVTVLPCLALIRTDCGNELISFLMHENRLGMDAAKTCLLADAAKA